MVYNLTNLSQLASPHTLKINVSSFQQDLCYEQSAKVNLLINRHVQLPLYTLMHLQLHEYE